MKCKFCHYPLKLSHTEDNQKINVYECLSCPMLIFHSFKDKETEPFKTSFMLNRNGKSYMWTNNLDKGHSYVCTIGARLTPNEDPVIIRLPKIVEVTPETVDRKLSFYLLFK